MTVALQPSSAMPWAIAACLRGPSEAVSFMQQFAGNRLAEAEVMFLPEFNHAPNGFRSRRLSVVGRVPCWRSGGALNEAEEVLFQGHAAGSRPRQEIRFDFRLEVQGDRHRFLSVFTICQP
jgi:hypothetical protein